MLAYHRPYGLQEIKIRCTGLLTRTAGLTISPLHLRRRILTTPQCHSPVKNRPLPLRAHKHVNGIPVSVSMKPSPQAWHPSNRSLRSYLPGAHSLDLHRCSATDLQKAIPVWPPAPHPYQDRNPTGSPMRRRYLLLLIPSSTLVTLLNQSEPPPPDEARDAMYAELCLSFVP